MDNIPGGLRNTFAAAVGTKNPQHTDAEVGAV